MEVLIVVATALIKAYVDLKRWPFKNHWVGLLIVSLIILPICWFSCEIYPIFLYNVIFNQSLNIMKGLPFFYMGDTAKTDQIMKNLFGNFAGQVWFFCNLTMLILTF